MMQQKILRYIQLFVNFFILQGDIQKLLLKKLYRFSKKLAPIYYLNQLSDS